MIDDAIASARNRAAFMPQMADAAALKEQASDGTALTPTDAALALYRRRLRLKRDEWAAKHEGEEVDAELQLIIGTSEELLGVATFRSGETRDFDEGRFARDYPELYNSYTVTKPTRTFNIRW